MCSMHCDQGNFTPEKYARPVKGRITVGQREYAILAPRRDQRVDSVVTYGMAPLGCFGLSLHDPANQLGMFAHLDTVEETEPFVEKAASLLLSLGASRLDMTTVNLIRTPRRLIFMLNTIRLLSTLGLREDSVEWTDLGSFNSAILDPSAGLRAASFEELKLMSAEVEQTAHRLDLLIVAFENNSLLPPIRCIYRPTLSS